MALINKLNAIGDAIRSKTGETAEMTLEEMATAITNLSTGSTTGTLQTATITATGNRIYVDNYVASGENFILFYTAHSGKSGANYTLSMWMPDWSKHVYNMRDNLVTGESAYINAGIKQLKTSNIDAANTMTSLSLKTNSTITFDGRSFFYSSDVGCAIGTSAVLVYVGQRL